MEIWIFIFLMVVLYCIYYMIKNYKAANQSSVMILFYCQMLYSLIKKRNIKEDDYKKLITEIWETDSELLDYREFNKKWGMICKAFGVPVQYSDENNTYISGKVVLMIAAKMFDNRHILEQYREQSKRMKKINENIMNDTKY